MSIIHNDEVKAESAETDSPMRGFLLLLPRVEVTPTLEVDYQATDADVLLQLMENAEHTLHTILHGITAIGHLLGRSGTTVEPGGPPGKRVEALGNLTAALGEFAQVANDISAAGRSYLHDYEPQTRAHIDNVKV